MVKHRSPKPQLGVRVSLPLLRKQIEFYLVCFLFYRKRKRMSDFTLWILARLLCKMLQKYYGIPQNHFTKEE